MTQIRKRTERFVLSHPDRALVQRDQLIPGLAHVLDTGRLGAVLTTTLPDAGIERVTVEYLRYKPGSNCLARFSACSKACLGSRSCVVVTTASWLYAASADGMLSLSRVRAVAIRL